MLNQYHRDACAYYGFFAIMLLNDVREILPQLTLAVMAKKFETK